MRLLGQSLFHLLLLKNVMYLTKLQFSVNSFSSPCQSLVQPDTLGYTHSFWVHICDLQEHDPAHRELDQISGKRLVPSQLITDLTV